MAEDTLTKHIIFAFLVITAGSIPALAKYSGGSGDPNDPYQIATAEDLNDIGNHTEDFNKCFIMTADINLSQYTGTQFKIIGTNSITKSFKGVFDGNGHVIRNLTYTTTDIVGYVGLFGWAYNATIKNLGVEDVNVSTGGDQLGGLVGLQSLGTITNCHSAGLVTHSPYSPFFSTAHSVTGGLVGQSSGSITNCFSTASVTSFSYPTSSSPSTSYAGGLVGYQYSGVITDCCSTGSVSSHVSSTFPPPYSYSSSTTNGGLVGCQEGTITNSCSTSSVSSYFSSSYYPSISFSSVSGGLVGSQLSSGAIMNCYSTGSVISSYSSYSYAGGLVGYQDNSSGTKIEECYSTGPVSATGSHIYNGGLLGYYGGSGTVTACFWDTNTSGLNTSAGGEGKTTTQMQDLNTFLAAGWDFVWETVNGPNDIWAICEGVSYPKLAWQFIVGDIDNNKDVDFKDFALMGNKWMQADSNLYCGGTDLTGDGLVNLEDLATLTENWLDAQ